VLPDAAMLSDASTTVSVCTHAWLRVPPPPPTIPIKTTDTYVATFPPSPSFFFFFSAKEVNRWLPENVALTLLSPLMPAIASTSGLSHSEFVRLLFLQAQRETDCFFFSFRSSSSTNQTWSLPLPSSRVLLTTQG
jgi:hypothetical protein